jgi:Tol biopolymer transport system component
VAPYDDVSVSPDGRKLVFAATAQDGIWLRDFDALEWRRLPGTEGASNAFWSHDSRYVGFLVDKIVMKVDTTGGPPETVASLPDTASRSGTWNRNGDIVLGSWGGGSGGPLWRVSQAGGAAKAVTQVDLSKGEFHHSLPTFLPDGKHFLYFRSGPPDVEGMYVGSLDVDPGNQSRQRILTTSVPAVYANGYIFFPRAHTLMAQPFDVRRLEPQGVPVPVAQDVQITWFSTGVFSVSGNGVLAYRTAPASGTFQLAWFDRQLKTLSTFGAPGTDSMVALSPDGKRAVVKDAPYDVPGDLWTLDFASGRRTRLTFHKQVYSTGVWSFDSTRIAYSAGHLGDTLYEKAASGLGEEKVLLKEPGLRHFPTNWSRDGRFLLYHIENAPRTGYDLWALSLGDRRPHLMLDEAFNEWAGVFSPDMRWVAYVSLETGALAEVYVRPFRVSGETGQPSLGEYKWQVSKNHGNWPQWRVDREIVFNTIPFGTAVFAAPVNTNGTAFESGVPQRLPLPPNVGTWPTPQSTPDGQRLLVEVSQVPRTARTSINVVLNWPVLLKEVK